MRYIGLNSREYKLNLTEFLPKTDKKSSLHLNVREFLKSNFPLEQILEEVSINGFPKNKTLYLDFLLPISKIIVEAHGQQHCSHISFFHSNKVKFLLAKNNDRLKKEWANLNGFTLYEFYWNESEEQWIIKLKT